MPYVIVERVEDAPRGTPQRFRIRIPGAKVIVAGEEFTVIVNEAEAEGLRRALGSMVSNKHFGLTRSEL